MRIVKYFGVLAFVIFLLAAQPLAAQCPMCKANVESTLKGEGRKTGLGLNDGIIILFCMPYIAIGVVGLLWYRNSHQQKKENADFKTN